MRKKYFNHHREIKKFKKSKTHNSFHKPILLSSKTKIVNKIKNQNLTTSIKSRIITKNMVKITTQAIKNNKEPIQVDLKI